MDKKTVSFLNDRLRDQRQYAKRVFDEYQETKDPKIIIAYIKKEPHAVCYKWINRILAEWIASDRYDLLKALGPGRGIKTNATKYENTIDGLMLINRVRRLTAQGMTVTDALDLLAVKVVGGFEALKAKYYRALKWKPRIWVKNNPDHVLLFVGPTIIDLDSNNTVFGNIQVTLNKKTR